jgi:hypothetical protein
MYSTVQRSTEAAGGGRHHIFPKGESSMDEARMQADALASLEVRSDGTMQVLLIRLKRCDQTLLQLGFSRSAPLGLLLSWQIWGGALTFFFFTNRSRTYDTLFISLYELVYLVYSRSLKWAMIANWPSLRVEARMDLGEGRGNKKKSPMDPMPASEAPGRKHGKVITR